MYQFASRLVGKIAYLLSLNIQNRQKPSEIIKTARGTMSQRAFGKLLGVSATAVQLWERGSRY
jgi:DNA-binding transcriptional regulator YiaG